MTKNLLYISALLFLNSWTIKKSLVSNVNLNRIYFTIDTDGDGIPNTIDLDDENDGINDIFEGFVDTDGDGIPNSVDLDSDNDGIPDTRENGITDVNGDGKIDGFLDANNDGLSDIGSLVGQLKDFDSDGKPNSQDLDSDNDGITDVIESGGSDQDNNGQIGSGTGPSIPDADNDGLANFVDPISGYTGTTVGPGTPSPTLNTDGTTGPNYLDIDADNDGIVDNIEGQSTSGYVAPAQTDADGDGILDTYDVFVGFGGAGINPVNTDGADTPDYTDLNSDNDALTDLQENGLAAPGATDADGDGLLDGFDTVPGGTTLGSVANITNGNQTPNSFPNIQVSVTSERDWREAPITPIIDTDGDGILDNVDIDDDNDGILDTDEGTGDADQRIIPNYLDLDSDNDGITDVIESGGADANGDGLIDCYVIIGNPSPNVNAQGLVSCLIGNNVGLGIVNDDNDLVPNHLDLDSDNDGIWDIIEAGGAALDLNNDGKIDNYIDVDLDGIHDAIDPTNGNLPNSPATGNVALKISAPDTTGDGRPDGILSVSKLGSNEYSVYPNPVRDVIKIEVKNNLKQIIIEDVTGKIILRQTVNINLFEANLSSLEKGIYVLKLVFESNVISQKLVKQ